MDVSKTDWVLVGAGSDAELVVQNTGNTRIGFFIGTTLPQSGDSEAANYVALESGDHGILAQGSVPVTISTLATNTENFYARSLGPVVGKLYVNAN
jgi:hypothetical protein